MSTVFVQQTDSPLGPLVLACTKETLVGLTWHDGSHLRSDLHRWGYSIEDAPNAMTKRVINQLNEYFSGKRKAFDIPMTFHGTDFQKTVWKTLCEVPFGKCLSYRELAHVSGFPNASRAVGTTMKNNHIPILVPCHRVIRSDGKMGGFNGGEKLKKYLLNHEGISRS